MTDLRHLNLNKHIDNRPPEEQLKDSMLDAGITPPDNIILDGVLRRFDTDKKSKKSGWYVGFGDGVPAGCFGDWRTGLEVPWKANINRDLTPAEEMANARKLAEARELRAKERARLHEHGSNTARHIWENASHASDDHPYLIKKQIKSNGARVTGDGRLIVPLFGADGEISSLQYISHDSEKRYHSGAATKGKFFKIGEIKEKIYIAEGFATAATIYETTLDACIVSYSASNLVPVTEEIRLQNPDKKIIIVADNDENGIGENYASQAASKFGAQVIVCPISGDVNDYKNSGHDLSQLLEPPKNDWLIPALEFCKQPAPIRWLKKGWIQRDALIMVHGPSGGGKTFVVLDWCLNIAQEENVIYLAGEGHHGLKGRIAAWVQENRPNKLDLMLSRSGCDLNSAQGYQKVVDSIHESDCKPSLIVVDTLHRFLDGDENSSKDTKTMLDACSSLMSQFGCSVLLVHHTGVSSEAQHRARGSSAWRGALDIEISVVPAKNDKPITIKQQKSKDSEASKDIYYTLKKVEIEGWLDDEGAPVASAVIDQTEGEPEPEHEKQPEKFFRYLQNFWHQGGAKKEGGLPVFSRDDCVDWMESAGFKPGTIKNYAKPSFAKGPIGWLVSENIIKQSELDKKSWIVIDQTFSSRLLLLA